MCPSHSCLCLTFACDVTLIVAVLIREALAMVMTQTVK